MADRTAPYPSYNFLVDWKGPNGPDTILGGFSDVSGLSTEIHVSEYRNGNEAESARPQDSRRAQGRRRDAEARPGELDGLLGLDFADAHARRRCAKRKS